jgi:methylphosphotriester-DNA--protein-cysteine methyltransferase
MAMAETTGRMVLLSDLAPALSRDLERRDALVAEAVARLAAAPVPPDSATFARTLGISLRQLERRFHRAVGLVPKHFARMRRFQKVFQAIEQQRPG